MMYHSFVTTTGQNRRIPARTGAVVSRIKAANRLSYRLPHQSSIRSATHTPPAMASRLLLPSIALFAFLSVSSARITTLGQSTAEMTRAGLPDTAFRVRPTGAPPIVSPDGRFSAFATSPSANPALAATDTQVQVNTVTVRAGSPFLKHFHPRGTETLTVHKGALVAQLWFEGFNPRMVRVHLQPFDSVVYPQGIIHLSRCVSKEDCVFTAVFNTADPGLTPVS